MVKQPQDSADITQTSTGYTHATLAMALEVDKLSERVLELTAQNEELESTIAYHLKAMDEFQSESEALHSVLKLIKSRPSSKVSEITPKIVEALVAAGCSDLAGLLGRREIQSSSDRPRRNSDQLDILVNLILNGHTS